MKNWKHENLVNIRQMNVYEEERWKKTGDGLERAEDSRVNSELANAGEKLDDLRPQVTVVKAVF